MDEEEEEEEEEEEHHQVIKQRFEGFGSSLQLLLLPHSSLPHYIIHDYFPTP